MTSANQDAMLTASSMCVRLTAQILRCVNSWLSWDDVISREKYDYLFLYDKWLSVGCVYCAAVSRMVQRAGRKWVAGNGTNCVVA